MASTPSRTGRHLQRYHHGCRQVVGCIPYRYKKPNQLSSIGGTLIEELEFLLISSQKSERMMFPKGGWEIDETMEQAASRETLEEAGVDGIVEPKLGKWSFKSKSQGTYHEGHMFPLLVTELLDSWPEKNVRRRIWMTAKEAREACDHSWMKEALDMLVCRLKNQQPKEEENQRSCAIEYLRTEEPRISIVSQSGEEEVDRCLVS